MIPVSTRSYNNSRTGANVSETILTQAALKTRGIKVFQTLQFEGDARGSEGAMLIQPNVHCADGLFHDVGFVATMANNVYGYDANTGTMLWMRRLGNPIKGLKSMDMFLINDHWGILSTPVIDSTTGIGWVVSWNSVDGTMANAHYTLHGIRLDSGADAASPISLDTATYQPPGSFPLQHLNGVARKQRCGLLMTTINGVKTIFIGAGSFLESASTNQGWVIAVDVTNSAKPFVSAAWCSSIKFGGSGIWQGGQGLTADTDGYIYGMTGNGSFDGVTDLGESFFKLKYTPPNGTTSGKLSIVDWWSPFSDTGRVGDDPTLVDESLITNPRTAESIFPHVQIVDEAATTNMNGYDDQDLGSGGPLIIPSLGFMIGAGKDGIAYVLHMNNMGKTVNTDFASNKIQANYAKLASPPLWFTYYNPDVSPRPIDLTDLDTLYQGKTHHQHSTPVYYESSVHGHVVFTWGENANLRAWNLSNDGVLSYLAGGAEMASPDTPPPGGMPGGMISLSTNGTKTGSAILWACVPYGDANKKITQGRLIAYDAENFVNGQIQKLWDSADWNIQFSHNKFNIPHVWNGIVYCPTYDDRVLMLNLA
jgi:hypothetical protein